MEKIELENILHCILDVYNKDISNEQKYNEVSRLWTRYYKLSNRLGIQLDFAYQLYLMCESECYKIYQEPIIKNVDKELVIEAVHHLQNVIDNNNRGILDGISREEATVLLNFVVNHVRTSFGLLGIDIEKNSLNGFCELGQALSILPFENLGLKVTKNRAKDAFGFLFHHCFGTVWFPILENGEVLEEGYLIDTTYRQFFSSVRCNEGRYYALEKNTGLIANPDPGYFVTNEQFAKDLMADGYVKFTKESACLYGEAFYLSSLEICKRKDKDDRNFDYYRAILNSSSDYSIHYDELEGLEVDCFNINNRLKEK